MGDNPHFLAVDSWSAAEAALTFSPVVPGYTAGRTLESLRIHARDHTQRELPIIDQTLEAQYGTFVVSQRATADADVSRRLALETSYGADPTMVTVGANEARAYDHGATPAADDPDGRMPAVVTWADGAVHHLVASHDVSLDELLRIAESMAPPAGNPGRS